MSLQFTKITNNLEADNREMQVWLWDIGPQKPAAPKRPARPKGNQGDPEFDLATIDYEDALDEYKKALRLYKAAKEEFEEFRIRHGGPYEMEFWSCDARDALTYDKAAVEDGRQAALRYHISSRTRGYAKLPNMGLPEGMKPGRTHAENVRRESERAADLIQAMRADPVFGSEESRP